MLRRYAPTALVEHLPDYLRLLLGQPAVSAPVIAKVWFSYCLGWSRAGGDGARLFRRLDTGHGALLRHVISLQELLR